MSSATLTTKGQVTIPKAIRDYLRLREHDKIEILASNEGEAIIRPVSKKIDDLYGIFEKSAIQKPGMRAVSTEAMRQAIKNRCKAKYL